MIAVVDDLVALVVIATAYTDHVSVTPLMVAAGLFAGLLALAVGATRLASMPAAVVLGVGVGARTCTPPESTRSSWFRRRAGHERLSAGRTYLEQVTELTRSFREQPTPALARSAQLGVAWIRR